MHQGTVLKPRHKASKTFSSGARESAQPRIAAKGACATPTAPVLGPVGPVGFWDKVILMDLWPNLGTPQHGAFEFCTTVLNTTDQDTSIMGWMCGRPLWSAGPVSTSIMWSQIPWVTSCTTPPTQSSKSPATHEYIRNTAYAGCKHQIPMHTALVTKRVKPKATTQGMFALGWYRMMPW